MNNRIVFPGPVPAAKLWLIVAQFARAKNIRMLTEDQKQNAMLIYCTTQAILN